MKTAVAVRNFAAPQLRFAETERVLVLYLDAKRRLIHDQIMWEGTPEEAPVFTGPILRRALELGAAGLIIVHNHPSGDSSPSRADRVITRRIADAASMLDVNLYDHVIVAHDGFCSFRELGLL